MGGRDILGGVMKPPFRSKQEVIINAPLETVWAFNMDLTKIPTFHPRVHKVDLLPGKAHREAGVAYQCHILGGKHTCVEKDIEVVPMEKIVTVLPEDTIGISKIFTDYVVESTLKKISESSTKIEISHYYSTKTFRAKLLNLIAKRKFARETQAMLNAMKGAVETAYHEQWDEYRPPAKVPEPHNASLSPVQDERTTKRDTPAYTTHMGTPVPAPDEFEQYRGAVTRYIRYLVRDATEADDLTQEALPAG
jgi:hypothetical protein